MLRGKIKEKLLGRMDGAGATAREAQVDYVSAFLHTVSCSVVHSGETVMGSPRAQRAWSWKPC